MKYSRVARTSIPRLLGVVALILLGLTATGCKTRIVLNQCTGNCVSLSGVFSFSEKVSSVSAWSLYDTREVDSSVYAPDSTATPTGTVKVTLANGSTVTYSGSLYRDTTTAVAPTTSGHTVLVYRPSNPNALQAFIDQYKDQAASVDISTTVKLQDISGGTVSSSVVDLKAHYNSTLAYVGSLNSRPPSYEPFNQDL